MATIAVTTGLHLPVQLNSSSGYSTAPEIAVMTFARRHTVSGDLWLVPTRKTEFEKVRMQGGIPVLVNWKTHPYKDREIIEWYRRNLLAESFYRQACKTESALTLRKLAGLYGVNHVILDAQTPLRACPEAKVIFRDSRYVALELLRSWATVRKKTRPQQSGQSAHKHGIVASSRRSRHPRYYI